jgi:uncharacterized protein
MSIRWKRLNRDLHRDIGYFCTALVIVYCISGIAFNHINEWNPDFILIKDTIPTQIIKSKDQVNSDWIKQQMAPLNEAEYKLYDFPTPDQVKVYMSQSSLHIYLHDGYGVYESIKRRPAVYQMNLLHRNNVKYWKWASDVFAVLLIGINLTGLFILKGKYGITGRGKWLLAVGFAIPIMMFIIFGT